MKFLYTGNLTVINFQAEEFIGVCIDHPMEEQ